MDLFLTAVMFSRVRSFFAVIKVIEGLVQLQLEIILGSGTRNFLLSGGAVRSFANSSFLLLASPLLSSPSRSFAGGVRKMRFFGLG